jgi:hypothetical protein
VFCRDAGDGDVDGEDGADDPQLAIASEILPPILELLPNLKSSDPKESAAAAAERPRVRRANSPRCRCAAARSPRGQNIRRQIAIFIGLGPLDWTAPSQRQPAAKGAAL